MAALTVQEPQWPPGPLSATAAPPLDRGGGGSTLTQPDMLPSSNANVTSPATAAQFVRVDQRRATSTAANVPASAARHRSPADSYHRHRRKQSLRRTKNSSDELRRRNSSRRGAGPRVVNGNPRQNNFNRYADIAARHADAGRQFTVGNIGHNGILYLRPVIRPANQRDRVAKSKITTVTTAAVPATPPRDDPLHNASLAGDDLRDSILSTSFTHYPITPTHKHTPTPPNLHERLRSAGSPGSNATYGHGRSLSFSTLDDRSPQVLGNDPRSFRIVIDRPKPPRPRSAEDELVPQLEVKIPNYKLGTPRFSARGTAIIRGSICTRGSDAAFTDDLQSSGLSRADIERFFPGASSVMHSAFPSRRPSAANGSISLPHRRATVTSLTSPSTARTSLAPIGPQIYDILTAKADDPSVIHLDPNTGAILAATPSRLIAHITSPSFLDYELLSDFFLTFRAFLNASDLVSYLIARLRWAVSRADDCGRIVRVRTFVALRHWILNYFVDDFLPDFALRQQFCIRVNSLCTDLRARADGGGGDLKILGELKKCWRRTCAQYWDDPASFGVHLADNDLQPGGRLDAIDEQGGLPYGLIPKPRPLTPATQHRNTRSVASTVSASFRIRPTDWSKAQQIHQQSLASAGRVTKRISYGLDCIPMSPGSDMSVQIMSCSIPMRPLNPLPRGQIAMDAPLYPHPVTGAQPDPNAPKFASSSRVPGRPANSHKRSGSFSDALRDNRAPLSLSKSPGSQQRDSSIINAPGSIVRGTVFQPGAPYTDLRSPPSQRSIRPQVLPENEEGSTHTSLVNGPAVKKLIGTVKRALSKQHGMPFTFRAPTSSNSSSERELSTFPTVNQPATDEGGLGSAPSRRRRQNSQPEQRIDLLAAQVEESFKEAVAAQSNERGQQDANAAAEGDTSGQQKDQTRDSKPMSMGRRSTMNAMPSGMNSRMTSGSRSILIYNDTGHSPDVPPVPTLDLLKLANGQMSGQEEDITIGHAPDVSVMDSQASPPSDPFGSMMVPSRASDSELQTRSAKATSSFAQSSTTPLRPSLLRHSKSHRTTGSGSLSLRRFASYHSGMGQRHPLSSDLTTESDLHTTASDYDPFPLERIQPARQLKRKPGGNLRAVDKIQDLATLSRRGSTGSLSNRTHSITNSVVYHPSARSLNAREVSQQPSLSGGPGPIADASQESSPVKKPISLVQTHSSQPNMRPSFEAEVARIAALPDDDEEDGGIATTLLKLEGKFEKSSPDIATAPIPESRSSGSAESVRPITSESIPIKVDLPINHPPLPDSPRATQALAQAEAEARTVPIRQESLANRETVAGSANSTGSPAMPNSPVTDENSKRRTVTSRSVAESEESYSSVPLLERGLSEFIPTKPRYPTSEWSRPSAKPAPLGTADAPESSGMSAVSSMPPNEEPVARRRPPKNRLRDPDSTPRESFLLDDLSSDMSENDEAGSPNVSFYNDGEEESPQDASHPFRHPPTPPHGSDGSPYSQPDTRFQQGLPTPGPTPTFKSPPIELASPPMPRDEWGQRDIKTPPRANNHKTSAHLPFVLGYDSELLAKQLTLIEKDALDEIDWRELIELRWTQTAPSDLTNWVNYLRIQPAPRGVDVVVARFNLVVKWATSEIVLTERLDERVRVIIKYIHIANQALKIRNYATTYQITIALLSSDVGRLQRTWDQVPASDMRTLRRLETLVQPIRNFYSLRLDMETATLADGCIPFIGIYTRDLIFNAQKPAFLSEQPDQNGESLVNFERYHTAASIVKSLLRLLEASSRYDFEADPVVASKCLWMATLPDDEITARSKRLEA